IATATIVYHVQPFFVVLLGMVLLGERVTLDQIVWMIAAFVGVVLASGLVVPAKAIGASWAPGIAMA
ncbi:EamA family transporter, partial [Stenotrophomonas maltophilia]|uniref:EamA family transporter n=1 Tax=Stenotrophomonas maltophilia TaxID=40324 RepID=UPI0013DCF8CE